MYWIQPCMIENTDPEYINESDNKIESDKEVKLTINIKKVCYYFFNINNVIKPCSYVRYLIFSLIFNIHYRT